MPLPSVTYTFTAGTTIDSGQVNTNFSNLISSLTDGTKDLTVNTLALTSTLSVGGNLTLSGSVVGNILPSADATYGLGSTSVGFTALYLDNTATDGGTIYFDGSNTSYLQSSTDGATLTIGGFATLALGSSVSIKTEATPNDITIHPLNVGSGATPTTNTLYANVIPKAWAFTSSGATLQDGVNLSVSAGGTGIYNYTFATNMASANYAVLVSSNDTGAGFGYVTTKTTSSFTVIFLNSGGTAVASRAHGVLVFGEQS